MVIPRYVADLTFFKGIIKEYWSVMLMLTLVRPRVYKSVFGIRYLLNRSVRLLFSEAMEHIPYICEIFNCMCGPRGGQGAQTPPLEKSQKYRVS